MTIVVCHNYYQQPGGEDRVFADETALLESYGHEVVRYVVHNDDVGDGGGAWQRLGLARRTAWNGGAYAEIGRIVRQSGAEVVHFHNTFPLISPAAYYAARRAGAAVVQTLHNYRILCPNGQLFRDGRPCESCVGGALAWRAVGHACYRGDRAATAVSAGMSAAHRLARTWRRAVDAYVALSQFARRLYVRGGLPADRIVVKPNFVHQDPGVGDGRGDGTGPYALFVGRLDASKGVETLLRAWGAVTCGARLRIVGDGPVAGEVRLAARMMPSVEWLGPRRPDEVQALMAAARLLVVPSLCYEGFPKVVAEALAVGTPALVSNLGSLAELIDDGRTGVHFGAADPAALAAAVDRLWGDEAALAYMRRQARQEFESKYTASRNYELLTNVYAAALQRRHGAEMSLSAM